MTSLTIERVEKRFGDYTALNDISVSVRDGQFVALLGPSGCGKTTLLRMIAGLESADSGRILIGDVDVTGLAPEKRRIAMMFQSYALLPHMTVIENVRFPLRIRGDAPKRTQYDEAEAALDLVKLSGLGQRYPKQLSGGQQQRVALARAVVAKPRVLLLDEPLSNLDARLRDEMQVELIELHKRLGLTTVFVTHDQAEALSLADLVVLMRGGQVEQMGTPQELYARPRTRFAAEFIGASNILDIDVKKAGSGWEATLGGIRFPVPAPPDGAAGRKALMVRQEDVRPSVSDSGSSNGEFAILPAKLKTRVFLGSEARYIFKVGEQTFKSIASTRDEADARPPSALFISQDSMRYVE